MTTPHALITRNLQEVINESDLAKILETRNLKIYWGTATTGRPHIAYFLPILKISDFLRANCTVTVLLADIHAFLDNLKAPVELIENRTAYYEKIIKAMLVSVGVDTANLKFVKGSEFQRSPGYVMDVYKMSTIVTEHDAKKAGSQVVRQVSNPLLSSLIYPAMQALDEEYLGVDAQFGGVDQRKIFTFAMKHMPLLGYRKRIYLMNQMIPGLNSEKMSSSDAYSKVDLCDSKEAIKKKINKCFCEEGNKENGLMHLMRLIIFPIMEIKGKTVMVERREGGDILVENYEKLERMFVDKEIHPADLKKCVMGHLNEIVEPVRNVMMEDEELIKRAYPSEYKNKK